MAEVDKSEKITVNVGLVDLGQIDLLVNEGFYANRTDFIRTAIRRQLESRSTAVNGTIARRALVLGTHYYSRQELETLRDAGQMVEIRVLGLATIAERCLDRARLGDHRVRRGSRGFPGTAGGEDRTDVADGLTPAARPDLTTIRSHITDSAPTASTPVNDR